MFDWLFEGRLPVYVLLAGSAALLLVVWWQTRKRGWLIAGGLAAVLVGVYALLDAGVETDREQIVRKVQEMITAVNANNLDGLMQHISDNFRSPGGRNKQQLRDTIASYLKSGMVSNVRVWDIECQDTPLRNHPPAQVFFRAKAESGREVFADCVATFDFDPQHGWRLRNIELFVPGKNEKWEIQL